jgi:DNA-binding transcriptional regulator YhcF (GntR family)
MPPPRALAAATPRVVQLADALQAEIASRGLSPGERFLTTAEAAREFRVSMALANRALQILAQRGAIERRQRTGPVVADPDRPKAGALTRVAVFAPESDVVREGLLQDGVIVGLQRALTGCEITFYATRTNSDAEALGELLNQLGRASEPVGVVLARSSLAAQRLAEERALPTVVFGTLRPSVTRLDMIDWDQESAGHQLAERTLGDDGRQLLVLMNERVLPGDEMFVDGIGRAMESRLGAVLRIRHCPPDDVAVGALVEEHVRMIGQDGGRVAVVCRSLPMARAAERCLATLDRLGQIGVADDRGTGASPGFLVARPADTPERQGEKIGELLSLRVADPAAPPRRISMSVLVDL